VLLVVFGAGASYDSDPDHPPEFNLNVRADRLPLFEHHRPPLANRLFDNRPQFLKTMQRFPACQPLIPQLRRAGVAVETELARLQAEASEYPERHRQLASIRYYLHFALWECQTRWRDIHTGITNYAVLLDQIEQWRYVNKEVVCFVTFNYDTMLEEAMSQVLRLEVQDMDSYHRWGNYSLFKLHGSINWGRVVEKGVYGPQDPSTLYPTLIDTVVTGSPFLTERYQLCNIEMRPIPDTGDVLFPALSIPVENKDELSCPAEHVRVLKEMVRDVTKMITIGWRATEKDFLKMLRAGQLVNFNAGIDQWADVLVVSGSGEGAEETLKNLGHYGQTPSLSLHNPALLKKRVPIGIGFTGLINNLETLTEFLRADG
jgi:hypothetical protein